MKAQASMEYVMVLAAILLIIIPATYMFYTYSQSSTQQIEESQITRMGRNIINTAEKVYYLGPPSAILIEEQMPARVKEIRVLSDMDSGINELVFYMDKDGAMTEMVFSSDVLINGSFTKADLVQGAKKINIEAFVTTDDVPLAYIELRGKCAASTNMSPDGDCIVELSDDITNYCQPCEASGAERPGTVFDPQWFDVCKLCDYDGDCDVDSNDISMITARVGESAC